MISRDEAIQHIDYSPDTGMFYRVVVSGGVEPGPVTNVPSPDGYIAIRVKGKKYKAHRLAWLIFYGKWPENEIDHINGIKTDNRIANLRDVDRSINMQNKRVANANCYSGLLGAYREGGKWKAQIKAHGKTHYIGCFSTKEEAHLAYKNAKSAIHGINLNTSAA